MERTTRFTLPVALPDDRRAITVADAIATQTRRLPHELCRSLTSDQCKEMAAQAKFTIDTGVQVYFCDPHSPWHHGTNENTNGLLRQYFPKGTDLSRHTQEDLDIVAAQLDGRPRQMLGFRTPSEKLNELLLAAAA